ncbi:retrovirus-related Pol polyprotein from transposon 412, partial [Nephila pilipes]
PLRLTTDQGTQFEASLFDALSKFLGTEKRHTTPYHPAANGQVERFHRQLKAAIMAHGNAQWTTVLPTILMGFRATWKEDLQATTAEMIYGAPIRLPGEFLCPSKPSADPVTFVGRLRETMQRLSPPTTQHHGHHTIFAEACLHPQRVGGHTSRVTAEGISPLPEKVAAITNFPKPETVKELRRFLAIINFYRRFIPHAAKTQAVLNSYLKGAKKNDRTPILWSEDSAAAFEKCKKDLAEATVLYHPSADASLAIVVDASDTE